MGRRSLNIDKNDLYNLYINNKFSTTKIAKFYGTSAFTIRSYCTRYGIPTRNYSEAALLLNYSGKNNPFYGKTHNNTVRDYLKVINYGKKLPIETRTKISNALIGKDNPNYIDGRTSVIISIRHLIEYDCWRNQVFERDNYTCQECSQRGGYLEAHHINPFITVFNEFLMKYNQFSPTEDKEVLIMLAKKHYLFWDINNGKVLCKKCHKIEQLTTSNKIKNFSEE
jgi:hypothetical protein